MRFSLSSRQYFNFKIKKGEQKGRKIDKENKRKEEENEWK
jgi:hypothetical protein